MGKCRSTIVEDKRTTDDSWTFSSIYDCMDRSDESNCTAAARRMNTFRHERPRRYVQIRPIPSKSKAGVYYAPGEPTHNLDPDEIGLPRPNETLCTALNDSSLEHILGNTTECSEEIPRNWTEYIPDGSRILVHGSREEASTI